MWLFVLSLSNILAAIGITIVIPLLSVGADIFSVDQSTAMWVMTGFMLTYASFMPIFGRMSDHFGRKKIFVIANIFFASGLFLSSLSNNFLVIVLGRMLQGFGAGGILPVASAFAVEMMEDKKEKALAIVNATYGIGMILGVNIGGIVYDYFGWEALFKIPFYLSIIAIILSIIFLKDKFSPHHEVKIDLLGSILFSLTMIFFLLFMREITTENHLFSYIYLGLSLLLFVLFIITELKKEQPAINLHLFRKKDYFIYNFLALFFGTVMFISITFLAPYAQLLFNLDVKSSVYAVDPMAFAMAFAIGTSGVTSRKFGSKLTIIFGSMLLTAGLFTFSYYGTGAVTFYSLSILFGFGLGSLMTPMNHLVMEAAGEKYKGEAAGVVSIMRSVGGVIGPALAGVILANTDFSSIFAYDNILESYKKIYELAGWFSVLVLLFGIIGFLLKKNGGEKV